MVVPNRTENAGSVALSKVAKAGTCAQSPVPGNCFVRAGIFLVVRV